jgi:hypothetical protein
LRLAEEALLSISKDGMRLSTAMVNTIVSGWAERGEVEEVQRILRTYFVQGLLTLDADTICFALEVLGKYLRRRERAGQSDEYITTKCLTDADEILTMMEDHKIIPTANIVREYVELLCLGGEVELATQVVRDFRNSNFEVNAKTLYRVASVHMDAGNPSVGMEIAGWDEDVMMHIQELLRREESKTTESTEQLPLPPDQNSSSPMDTRPPMRNKSPVEPRPSTQPAPM